MLLCRLIVVYNGAGQRFLMRLSLQYLLLDGAALELNNKNCN